MWINVYPENRMHSNMKQLWLILLIALVVCSACASNSENAHTTATTFVSPPPRQVLRAETRPAKQPPMPDDPKLKVDTTKPLLVFNLPDGKTFREGEEVVIDFALANAKLKGDGGDYRVRYFVDDEEMQWIDRWEQIVLTGWTAGKHTIRVELVGPDGWPYRNGDYNVVTREISIVK